MLTSLCYPCAFKCPKVVVSFETQLKWFYKLHEIQLQDANLFKCKDGKIYNLILYFNKAYDQNYKFIAKRIIMKLSLLLLASMFVSTYCLPTEQSGSQPAAKLADEGSEEVKSQADATADADKDSQANSSADAGTGSVAKAASKADNKGLANSSAKSFSNSSSNALAKSDGLGHKNKPLSNVIPV